MKKIISIILIFTFISIASANNNLVSFDLSKANTNQSSLLNGAEGKIYPRGSVSCFQCEIDLHNCLVSGQSVYVCIQGYAVCQNNCTGIIP